MGPAVNDPLREGGGSDTHSRGRHKAALNFGDCLAYASACAAGDTLLFGDDFAQTDILPAKG
jgi:uncharacterized protein with PIN domain